MQTKLWPFLQPNDVVDVIAPAGRLATEKLQQLSSLLTSWQLKVNIAPDIFGDDLLCANTDAVRFKHLQNALLNTQTKAIICARGGYGATRLIPELFKLPVPMHPKLFIGISDITALHIFLQQQWQWPTLHAALGSWSTAESSIELVRQILFGETTAINFNTLELLNNAAKQNITINSTVVGGNLSLIQTSLGTAWQLDTRDKIILLEDVSERAYRIDRMLEHLYQANLFVQAKAVVFGDFVGGEEPNGTSLIKPVLQRFAEKLSIPVVHIKGIGHDKINNPVPLMAPAILQLGNKSYLSLQIP